MSLFGIKIDTSELAAFVCELDQARRQLPALEVQVVNRTASRARPVVVRALTAQTGLPKRTVTKAVKVRMATPGKPAAELVARGGDVSLKYFGAHEEGAGVAATVKGHRVTIAGGFTRSGKAPGRYLVKRLGGQVFVNTQGRKWGGHIRKVKSGVLIPVEMTQGPTLAAFERVAETDLPAEAARALAALLRG